VTDQPETPDPASTGGARLAKSVQSESGDPGLPVIGERDAQEQGTPPDVAPSVLGAALDRLSGLKSHVVNIVAVAAFHENQRRADVAEQSADEYRSLYHESDKETAVLKGRLDSMTEQNRVRRIVLSIGGPVFGVGLTLMVQATWSLGLLLLVLGSVLMALGHGLVGGGE